MIKYNLIQEIISKATHSELLVVNELVTKELRLSEIAIKEGMEQIK